ncbi:hypothetical protein NAL19_391 [Pectobacterium sp. F1-1]|nr:hypothetical protein NAL19_391 [Pectobacterium sp. F1-1]
MSWRFIPAGAGNTLFFWPTIINCAVYPRWRGEHVRCDRFRPNQRGLSPLARGTRAGIFPFATRFAVYPRWRGEHMLSSAAAVSLSGLSPLARGTLIQVALEQLSARFIPAGAGNTTTTGKTTRLGSVYPRWRGEHLGVRFRVDIRGGLSPLARGTPIRNRTSDVILRFIPAGAGNTLPAQLLDSAYSVYPRWRGEHGGPADSLFPSAGLSPLARGTQPPFRSLIDGTRFIPAGAGNTTGVTGNFFKHSVYPRWRGEHL